MIDTGRRDFIKLLAVGSALSLVPGLVVVIDNAYATVTLPIPGIRFSVPAVWYTLADETVLEIAGKEDQTFTIDDVRRTYVIAKYPEVRNDFNPAISITTIPKKELIHEGLMDIAGELINQISGGYSYENTIQEPTLLQSANGRQIIRASYLADKRLDDGSIVDLNRTALIADNNDFAVFIQYSGSPSEDEGAEDEFVHFEKSIVFI